MNEAMKKNLNGRVLKLFRKCIQLLSLTPGLDDKELVFLKK